jgi:16S rRNA (guanine1207-N2)-methyltransferase
LLVAQAHASPGDVVVFLHPSSSTAVLAVAQEATAGRIVVVHRRLDRVERIARDLTHARLTGVDVRHAHGRLGFPDGLRADLVVLEIPTERAAMQQLLYDATLLLRVGGRLLVAGGTDEGIKPAVRLVEQVFGAARTLGQGGGHRVVEAVRPEAVRLDVVEALVAPYHDPHRFRELSCDVAGRTLPVFTRPGVFSWDHLDEATAILASVMTPRAGDRVLDLGCGAGVLGAFVAATVPDAQLTLVDADSESVRCAERTMRATGHTAWQVRASDVTSAVSEERFDLVVSNPPFHQGKATDLELPRRFIEGAHAVLARGGRLQLVANRTLPYERELERVFGDRRTLHDGARFKVLEAVRR